MVFLFIILCKFILPSYQLQTLEVKFTNTIILNYPYLNMQSFNILSFNYKVNPSIFLQTKPYNILYFLKDTNPIFFPNYIPIMQPVFESLSQQIVKQIQESPVESQCLLFKRRKVQQSFGSIEESKYQKIALKLELRKNYILQVCREREQIISGFECDIDVTFKVIRSMTQQDSDEVGEILGIQFRSDKFYRKAVFMYIQEDNNKMHAKMLQQFCQIISTKYLIQDGFHQIYRAVKKIGKGVTASVYKAIRLTDQKEVAVKSFKKQLYYAIDNGRGKMAFEKEFRAMTEVNSNYVCKLIGVFQSDNSIYIVMELLTRSLYSYLKINGLPSLKLAKQLMVKLLIGLDDMHKKFIMHRDLKLENIMVVQKNAQIHPVIIDLGLAEYSTSKQFLYTKCGTPGYVAPQILNLKSNELPSPPYSHHCDIFSLGVIFYILLAGKTLFEGQDERQVVRKNKQCEVDYEFKNQTKFSTEMKDLLKKMLQKDPLLRMSCTQLLNHEFFRQVESLKQFQTRNTSTFMELVEQKERDINKL